MSCNFHVENFYCEIEIYEYIDQKKKKKDHVLIPLVVLMWEILLSGPD